MISLRTFQVPVGDKKIIFIPMLKKLFLVNNDVHIPDFVRSADIPKEYRLLPDYKFKAVQLIVNNGCNLRCIYCYTNAGTQGFIEIPFETAKVAIDKVISDIQTLGLDTIEVNFIGGEPTLSLRLIRRIITYLKDECRKTGLKSRIGIVTNGVFSSSVADFIINHFDYVTVSIDGDKQIHDTHRPMASGRGSFKTVFANAKRLYDSGIAFGPRATVSTLSVDKILEIVRFLHSHFPNSIIGIEPLQECDRCFTTDTHRPDPMTFARNFIKALVFAHREDVRIKNSIIRFHSRTEGISFCGANGQNFGITPDGYVTACTRVTSSHDKMANFFCYGRVDPDQEKITFFPEVYERLKSLVVDNISACKDCFARFNCKGDCPISKADFSPDFRLQPSNRCEANKYITKNLFMLQLGLLD